MRRHNTKDMKDSCWDLKQHKRHQHALMNSIKKKEPQIRLKCIEII